MEYKITIPGTLPGLNDYIQMERGPKGKYVAARLKREVENGLIIQIKHQLPGLRIQKPVHISYLWAEPDKRRDLDNVAWAKKLIQDSLVKARVLQGDGWRHIKGFKDDFVKDNERPRIEIVITEVE